MNITVKSTCKSIVEHVTCFREVVNSLLQVLWDILDNGMIIRRVSFGVMLWFSITFIIWSMDFAANNPQVPSEKALLIGAIGVPLSALQGYVFKLYVDNRQASHTPPPVLGYEPSNSPSERLEGSSEISPEGGRGHGRNARRTRPRRN